MPQGMSGEDLISFQSEHIWETINQKKLLSESEVVISLGFASIGGLYLSEIRRSKKYFRAQMKLIFSSLKICDCSSFYNMDRNRMKT